ncbi:cobalt-precorrin-5B (C(1))-methyltransferase CbiD [Desulfonatronovibrio magnus]|uniref:cobalt-precorrin-5B (C(1))-methyltransferase CbiD n=1 Tax=Desulfonatronovibrio magnus TaxID=698827 RepID=UPI0006991094|nr:cobalt-precorrin-5B (C(1))-methyltransferase CbiD [Desulfonatronovibrio magnus]
MSDGRGLRSGLSTGTCAAAAARAAALLTLGQDPGREVQVTLPCREKIIMPIARALTRRGLSTALIRKDAGDDPDVTHGLLIGARVRFSANGLMVTGGKGVGRVTRPGLAVKPGNPAINPVPMGMIISNVQEVTKQPLHIEIFVPRGEKIAAATFNERLGIVGGISILGTSGRVRPFSVDALKETISLNIKSVAESGRQKMVLVPGGIGFRAAVSLGYEEHDIVEVANEWGFALGACTRKKTLKISVLGHPGKLLKFLQGDFQTHSSKSGSAAPILSSAAKNYLNIDMGRINTVEDGLARLEANERSKLGNFLASEIKKAIQEKAGFMPDSIMLINLKGDVFGQS